MKLRYIDNHEGLGAVRSALAGASRVALDCEAAGYHRYSDRLCLVQVNVGEDTFLVDTLAVDPAPYLRPTLEDPGIEVVMHGADFDVRLLRRDLGIGLSGLFDTQIAASLLGAKAIGLSSLLQERLGIHLSKRYQRADWAERPLPEPMREYAAQDTLHLGTLQEQLVQELEAAGRVAWAEEEFRELEKVRFEEGGDADPVSGIRAARALEPREVDRLREALLWRDRIAEEQDRALFRVASDAALVEVARRSPSTVRELEEIQGVGVSLARRHGEELLLRLREVNRLGAQEVHGYPRAGPGRNGSGRRPSPDVEARLGRLKAIRNRRASDLGIAKGTLLPNSVLQILAETPPPSQSALAGVPGVRSWQSALLAEELMKAM